jgi:integrase
MGSIGMVEFELKYVDAQRDRRGQVLYYYFRRSGRRWRLPGEPLSEGFMAEYRRLLAETAPALSSPERPTNPPGSFGALVTDYFAAPEFRAKAANTRKMYRHVLEPLAEIHGHKPVALLERRHIRQWRDARGDTPGIANMVVKVVRLLLSYAVDAEYRRDDPAQRIKLFKLGEYRAWTDEECVAFELRWQPGTMQRRAYALAKYTGQRCGDLARMTQAHCKDGSIRVVQQKTGAELWIRQHQDLTAELSDVAHLSLLTSSKGAAFDPDSLGRWFAEAIDQAGLPEDCVLHGLRKTAARMLAEAGCSVHEIMSVTGHKSLSEVERYTRAAHQKTLASAAILKLENSNRTEIAKPSSASSAKHKPRG